ncbi:MULTISPECIES: patatin-like phospholipase family protein [Bacillus]|uniref:patatin-like phospholipase family protein n=1 Tax=Bacillus TaxID=1386 RepID=UPI000917B3A8|nr:MULTISPECIES: patatin-like phospholipase family protein [Bacillus]PET46629.1 patatin [Bacillus cereus]PEW28593.1 patatin [Bacillus thuringiensis]PFB41324.1 patatin [Bacillus cereus]PFB43795.1 patatin [Bacillus thuringiensis]PFL84450.1 patatin [Bacillus cereus]
MNFPFKNLVFEGGGVKGIAYVGVLEALEALEGGNVLKDIKRVGGTSAGAIIALIVSLGYTAKETQQKLKEMNLESFMDGGFGKIGDTVRLLSDKHGFFKGDKFVEWLEGIIETKTNNKDITFKQLKEMKEFKDLYVQGTNLSTHRVETFSADNEKYEDMKIKEAIRISMSIPFFFEAVKMHDDYYVDGGVLSNYPVRLFDREKFLTETVNGLQDVYDIKNRKIIENKYVYNKETLGFRVDSKDVIDIFSGKALPKNHEISSFFDYIWNLTASLMENQENTQLSEFDFDRTVFINSVGVSAIDFKIGEDEQEELIESGKIAVNDYFKRYNNSNSMKNKTDGT